MDLTRFERTAQWLDPKYISAHLNELIGFYDDSLRQQKKCIQDTVHSKKEKQFQTCVFFVDLSVIVLCNALVL